MFVHLISVQTKQNKFRKSILSAELHFTQLSSSLDSKPL